METAVATVFLTKIAPKLFAFLQEKHEVRRSLERDIQYIRKEFRMITAAIQDHDRLRRSGDGDGDVQRVWIQLVRDLAYSIEDCVDRFAHRVTPPKTDDDAATSWLRQTVHGVKTVRSRQKFAAAIRELRKISEEASRLRACYVSSGGGGGGGQSNTITSWASASASASASTFSSSETHALATDLVGMDAPLDELLELISETEGQPEQLKVTSIVGFGGIGKTLLAREVYDTAAAAGCRRQHEPRAWVRAAEKGPGDVLKDVLHELGMPMPAGGSYDVNKLSTSIRECLGSKRFFIVIDDMRKEFWNIIKNAFPVVPGVSSRVIVTTAVRSIANACSSSALGHVYVMRTLDEEHSRKLFFKEASMEDDHPSPDDADELGSEAALKKCDGLPLALITTAQLLQSRGNPTRTEWTKLCDAMGELLETKDTMARMNRVLVHSYGSLPDHVVKTCLLYLGIYPAGRPVRTGSLMRRWSAEGFVEQGGAAADKFRELLDRSILQPVAMKNNTEVRACRTHGMMLEFILRKSVGESFVTMLRDRAQARSLPPGKVRWLSLQNYSGSPSNDLSLVRSLTIFGKASKSVLGFSKYELLRVLDLGECDDDNLDDSHVLEICNLSLLRYLRLGGNNITMLPKKISRLKHLETLDVRRTKIKILPIQVIRMPSLIHLFGVFKLDDIDDWKMSKLQASLSEKSNLETLAGFVADESQGFLQIMHHMEHLTKVKIWCDSTLNSGGGGGGNNLAHLSKAIQGFLQRGTNVTDARSLSLTSENWSQDMVNFSLENFCYLNSLKLHGNNIRSMPPFVTMLGGLTELCLSCPDQLINGDVLAAVSRVRSLHYLQLVAGQLGSFEVEEGVLDSLRRLCIVARSMADLGIRKGALPRLESLRLLCEDLDRFRGVDIGHLGRLREVALHDGVREEMKWEWRAAARSHPRRPRVLFVGAGEVDRIRMRMARSSKATGSSDGRAAVSAPPPPLITPVAAGVLQAQQINGGPEEPSAVARTAAGKTLARLTSGSKRTNETPAECLREHAADEEEVALAAGVHECDGGCDRRKKKNHASKRPKQVSLLVRMEEAVDDHEMLENPAAAAAATASPVVADVQTPRLNEGREHPAVMRKIASRLARDFKRRRFF